MLWYRVPNMLKRMVGLAFLTAGLAAIVASSVFGFRAIVVADAGLQCPTVLRALLTQRPRLHGEIEKRGIRLLSKPSGPPEVNLSKLLDELKDNEHSKDSEELAAMQAKAEQAWEADKLAKCQARTSQSRSPIGLLGRPKSQGYPGEVAGQDHRVGSGSQSRCRGGG